MTEVQASWLMPVQSAVPRTRRMATVAPAYFRSKRPALTYGLAQITDPTPSGDGLAQAETRQASQERLLSWHRTLLIRELADLRRKHRSTSATLADLRDVTAAILAMGGR